MLPTTCLMFCITVVCDQMLKINLLCEEERFSLTNNSVPDQTVWTTKACRPSKFIVYHQSPKASILN